MQPKNTHALNNQWKRQDTTQDLIVWFSGVMPNPAHAWTVRVADSKGYLGDYDATLQGNRFVIDTGQFADFPAGHYVLEIWETYSKDGKAETGIYPNPDSFVTFDINKNVVDDDLVKSFDLDEVLGKAAARANKAIVVDGTETLPAGSQAAVESRYDGERVHYTFKIPQGKTGQTGPVGPAPTLRVGSVTKVAPGGNPTASVSGSNGDYSLNLGIPEGQQGAKGDGFTDYGNITKSGDLNDYKRTGVADIQAVMANKPAGYEWNWGVLKVFAPDNGSHHIVQEWYPSGISNGTMFFRYYTVSGRGGKWGAWQKIGEVSSAPSPGLLYSGSFTVKTGSTPAWGYKEIPVGDIDGDTLTVTLTIHQTAGAKLDQICMALYDSKITKPLATYAYPATEQTNTITIVDKLPDKNAKLLFYSNDKTTNTNTTVEFSDVTIVGS